MSTPLTTDLVWRAMEREIFACLSWVTPRGEPRSAGICYVAEGRKLYIATERASWKARHIAANPHVALTVPSARSIPLLSFIRIPSATISFHGTARLIGASDLAAGVRQRLLRVNAADAAELDPCVILEVTPEGEFVTYGIGVSLLGMRDHQRARGRVAVA